MQGYIGVVKVSESCNFVAFIIDTCMNEVCSCEQDAPVVHVYTS